MGGRILVVDDERSMCETLADGLTPKGFDVQWTASPTEAAIGPRCAIVPNGLSG